MLMMKPAQSREIDLKTMRGWQTKVGTRSSHMRWDASKGPFEYPRAFCRSHAMIVPETTHEVTLSVRSWAPRMEHVRGAPPNPDQMEKSLSVIGYIMAAIKFELLDLSLLPHFLSYKLAPCSCTMYHVRRTKTSQSPTLRQSGSG